MNRIFEKRAFKTLLLLTIFCINTTTSTSQKNSNIPPENINVYKNTLFIGKSNIVIIYPPSDSTNTIVVTVSDGDIVPMDITSGMYYVTVKKVGKSTIRVFKEQGGNKVLLYSKIVSNKPLPLTKHEKELKHLALKPELTIAGFQGKRIPLSIVKEVKELKINEPYKIKSAVIYLSGPYSSDATPLFLNTNIFDDNILKIWKRLNVGSIITVDGINIIDDKGKSYQLEAVSYVVTEN